MESDGSGDEGHPMQCAPSQTCDNDERNPDANHAILRTVMTYRGDHRRRLCTYSHMFLAVGYTPEGAYPLNGCLATV